MNTVPKSVRSPIENELREVTESLDDLEDLREQQQADLDKTLANIERQKNRSAELAAWLNDNAAA
jgi:phage-related protein